MTYYEKSMKEVQFRRLENIKTPISKEVLEDLTNHEKAHISIVANAT